MIECQVKYICIIFLLVEQRFCVLYFFFPSNKKNVTSVFYFIFDKKRRDNH